MDLKTCISVLCVNFTWILVVGRLLAVVSACFVMSTSLEDLLAQLVKILVFPSPGGSMLSCSRCYLFIYYLFRIIECAPYNPPKCSVIFLQSWTLLFYLQTSHFRLCLLAGSPPLLLVFVLASTK